MGRAVLHLELPGVYAAAAVELGLVAAEEPVLVARRERVLDLAGVPLAQRGQPVRQALRVTPAATVLPVGAVSGAETYRAVWDTLLEVGPQIEPTAWHAGYVDVTGCLPRRGVKAHLAGVARRLQELTRQPPLRGLGGSKLIARHASPLGRIVAEDEALGFLHRQRLRTDHGLTQAMIELLDRLGCHRWGDMAQVPEERLRALFQVQGTVLHRWSQGIDPRPVRGRYPPPTETIHSQVEPDEHGLWVAMLGPLTETLAGRLKRRGEVATEVVLALGGRAGWRSFQRRLARGMDTAERLRAVALSLLPMDLDPWSVDEVRLTLRGLRTRGSVQGVLFLDEEEERRHLLDLTLSRLRDRFGLLSVGYGDEALACRQRLAEAVWQCEGVAL